MIKKKNDLEYNKAKAIFFKYDGSSFYMSRDGIEDVYRLYRIPHNVENEWLCEIKKNKLGLLQNNGNWDVIHFFNHHLDFSCLKDFLNADPKGKSWEKIAYLEELLIYILSNKKLSKNERKKGIEYINSNVMKIKKKLKSDKIKNRIAELEEKIMKYKS